VSFVEEKVSIDDGADDSIPL